MASGLLIGRSMRIRAIAGWVVTISIAGAAHAGQNAPAPPPSVAPSAAPAPSVAPSAAPAPSVAPSAAPAPRAARAPRRAPYPYPYRSPYPYPYPSYPPRAAPPPKDDEEQLPTPIGYREERTRRSGLIIAGGVVFGVTYLVPLSIAAAENFDNESELVAIPVVGPIMTAVRMDYGRTCPDPPSSFGSVDPTFGCRPDDGLVLAGIGLGFSAFFQAGAIAMFGAGFAKTKKRKIPYYAVVPMSFSGGGQGIGVTGAF